MRTGSLSLDVSIHLIVRPGAIFFFPPGESVTSRCPAASKLCGTMVWPPSTNACIGRELPVMVSSSVTSHLPLSRVFAYSAAKAAVVNLTQNLAREYAPRNVRINVLCPGFFPAEQNRKILDQQRVENIMRGTPMKRFG